MTGRNHTAKVVRLPERRSISNAHSELLHILARALQKDREEKYTNIRNRITCTLSDPKCRYVCIYKCGKTAILSRVCIRRSLLCRLAFSLLRIHPRPSRPVSEKESDPLICCF